MLSAWASSLMPPPHPPPHKQTCFLLLTAGLRTHPALCLQAWGGAGRGRGGCARCLSGFVTGANGAFPAEEIIWDRIHLGRWGLSSSPAHSERKAPFRAGVDAKLYADHLALTLLGWGAL